MANVTHTSGGHAHAHDHGSHTHDAHDHSRHVPEGAVRPDFDREALISARGITLTRGGRSLLEGIDFDVKSGEIVTVIGPNGAGKTTLVRVLLGLMRPDGGEIRRKPGLVLGYAPQRLDIDPAIPMTVERFLRLGGPFGAAEIADALGEVGAPRLTQYPLATLSGGELQRVVIARALLRRPQLIVLDEPVRGVDYVGEAELYGLIGELRDRHKLGVLLVSHDLHIVMARSDRVVCINRHVCCSGVPQSVARDPEYVKLFGPEAARSVAIYHHEHDHRHDLAGHAEPAGSDEQSG